MRDAAGQLADGLHFLRLHQGGLRPFLFGHVERQNEATEYAAVRRKLRHQRTARKHRATIGAGQRILVANLHAGQGARDIVTDSWPYQRPEHRSGAMTDDPVDGHTEPVRVPLVGVAKDELMVEVADIGWHAVGNQAQARFATP